MLNDPPELAYLITRSEEVHKSYITRKKEPRGRINIQISKGT